MNVFVLDNSTAMIEIYLNKFEKSGIEVNLMTAKNIRIAKEMLNENDFDLIIMEENIDEEASGIQFYKEEIKTNFPSIPVLFVSAVNEQEDIEMMNEEPVVVLVKPFGTRKFKSIVSKLIYK